MKRKDEQNAVGSLHCNDRRLLFAFDVNARSSIAALSRETGIPKGTVIARLDAFRASGVYRGATAVLNMQQLGFTGYAVFCRLENTTGPRYKKPLSYLEDHRSIYWVARLGGRFDLVFAVVSATVQAFSETLADITKRFPFIVDPTISIRSWVHQYRRAYLVETPHREKVLSYRSIAAPTKLDSVDLCILDALSEDCRATLTDLENKTRVDRVMVKRRLTRLESAGVVQGYAALIDPTSFGFEVYQLLVVLRQLTPSVRTKLESFCRQSPHITFLVESVGPWHFELTLEVQDQRQLQEILSAIRDHLNVGLVSMEIVVTFSYFEKYRICVGH